MTNPIIIQYKKIFIRKHFRVNEALTDFVHNQYMTVDYFNSVYRPLTDVTQFLQNWSRSTSGAIRLYQESWYD